MTEMTWSFKYAQQLLPIGKEKKKTQQPGSAKETFGEVFKNAIAGISPP